MVEEGEGEVFALLQVDYKMIRRIEEPVVATTDGALSSKVLQRIGEDAEPVADQVAALEAEELEELEAAGCVLYHDAEEEGCLENPSEVVWASKVPPPFSHGKLPVI